MISPSFYAAPTVTRPQPFDTARSDEALILRLASRQPADAARSIALAARRDAWVYAAVAEAFAQASQGDPLAIPYAMAFFVNLPTRLPEPEVSIDPDGEIAFEWYYGPRRVITVSVSRDGTLNYAGLVGPAVFHGVEILSDDVPTPVLNAIERIVQLAAF